LLYYQQQRAPQSFELTDTAQLFDDHY